MESRDPLVPQEILEKVDPLDSQEVQDLKETKAFRE